MNQDKILISDQKQENKIQSPEKDPDIAEFTSSMVHDLQAPLRSLTMFTELLAKEYQDDLDEKGQLYLDRISASGSRMQNLIEDLLTYSRTGTGDQTWMSVDLNQTVVQVQLDLQSEIAESGAKITVHDLPQLLLNPKEIHQLFQNLIANAIAYSDNPPQIDISVTAQGEEWLFAIEDRGFGIAPEFQSQIFEVFQRLQSDDLFPGSGIGLAICQKIVRRYEGIIWVESEVGRGSTFYFTLPMNPCPKLPTAKIVQRSLTTCGTVLRTQCATLKKSPVVLRRSGRTAFCYHVKALHSCPVPHAYLYFTRYSLLTTDPSKACCKSWVRSATAWRRLV